MSHDKVLQPTATLHPPLSMDVGPLAGTDERVIEHPLLVRGARRSLCSLPRSARGDRPDLPEPRRREALEVLAEGDRLLHSRFPASHCLHAIRFRFFLD